MNPSLTVVLPVRNADQTLRHQVAEVLEVASELTPQLTVLVIDDASQDDTYDTARELAAEYPQLRVMRNSRQRGLGPTLKSVRTLVKSDIVIVHDGTSDIDPAEIQSLWKEFQQRQANASAESPLPGRSSLVTIDDLRIAASGHSAMAMAHARLLGFHLMSTEPTSSNVELPPRRTAKREAHMGAIPPLPRPNFLSSLADFALGE